MALAGARPAGRGIAAQGGRVPVAPRARAQRAAAGAHGRRAAATASVTLYGSQGSRSPLCNWYMHECGVDFEMAAPRDPSNPHPMGQVPALRDGDVALFESGAILAYLADAYGGADTPAERADITKWLVFANATLDPVLFKETPDGKVYDTGVREATPPRALAALEAHLAAAGEGAYLLPSGFSAADCNVGAYLLYVLQFFRDASYAQLPATAAYALRCAKREGYKKAFGEETSAFLVSRLEADLAGGVSKKNGLFGGLF